ncbi:unnamed protein product [Parnassius apollo]|uniref:(apollo) hypothetical protein n=1 Tax=Parnassius apollo TaxID=110799 RepID=A0A8S3W5U6_PARAO|nr:unnamed protein product [Parnassius apollo]
MSNFTFSELAIIAIIFDNENERNSRKRRYWVHDLLRQRKSEGEYWNIRKRLLDDEEKFYIYFRMPRYLFYYILNIIEDDIYKRNTRFREAVSPEEKLAVTLRYLISGSDEAFPLKRNLLRPYPRSSGISEKERIYNNRLSRARRVVENAFGILYQKFGIYNKNLHLHPKYVDIVVFATCILHNVMRCYNITSDDEVNTMQSSANNDDEQRLLSNLSTIPEDISESSASAFETRDMFATYFQSPEGRVPWQHLI